MVLVIHMESVCGMSNELTLRNREFILDARRRKALLVVLFIVLILPIVALWCVFEGIEDGAGKEGVTAFFKHLLSQTNDEAFA